MRRAELPHHPRSSVVTGGASGIGLGIVRHFLALGGSVVAVDRDAQACASARVELAEFGDRVRVVEADIGSEQGAALAVHTALKAFRALDLLCNNAAYHPLETIEAHQLDTWRETFRVNVDGTMLCCRAAIPAMRQQGYGTIVNIGSVSGVSPYATGAAYAASKAAVAMLTRVLSLEVGCYGITVNCIAPGSIRHRAGADAEAEAPNIPMGYHGRPSDVAEMVAFLASNAGRYMTGATLVLDGGATTGRLRTR
ncbi:MAG: SDR family NAD(P)-dependent oxidoreductase [Candidatus Binatia bacterium]